jgi:hypothetical protein
MPARVKLKGLGVKKKHLWIMLLNSIIHANLTDSCMVTRQRKILYIIVNHKCCMVVGSSYHTMFD